MSHLMNEIPPSLCHSITIPRWTESRHKWRNPVTTLAGSIPLSCVITVRNTLEREAVFHLLWLEGVWLIDQSNPRIRVEPLSLRWAVGDCICLIGDFLADWWCFEWLMRWMTWSSVSFLIDQPPSSVYRLNIKVAFSLSFVTSMVHFSFGFSAIFLSLSGCISFYSLCFPLSFVPLSVFVTFPL